MSAPSTERPQARAVWPPHPDLFHLRLVKHGWPVPARILCTDDGWQAEVDGVLYPPHPDPAYAPMVAELWHRGQFITELEYRWRSALRDHARTHDSAHPSVNPRKAVDVRRLKPLQPRRTPAP
jgi:hypothetical protein